MSITVVLVTEGGHLILETGTVDFINITNDFEIVDGGKVTLESDVNFNGFVTWQDGGIIEAQGRAPFTTGVWKEGEYIELGGAFLNDGKILILNGPLAELDASGYNLHIGGPY